MRPTKAVKSRQSGFTLVELMVVVSIIGILAVIGVPHFRAYLLDARLNDALPHLSDIAARNRMHFIETRQYCCSGAVNDEDIIADELNVPIDEVGDFCFTIVCKDANLCGTVSDANFIAPNEAEDAGAEFEIWAILRGQNNGNVGGPDGACLKHTDKRPNTGLAQPNGAPVAGQHGQAIVLRYPAPVNGTDTVTGNGGHRYDWNAGISKTNALFP